MNACFDHGRLGGFFVPTRRDLQVGAITPVEVRFEDGKSFRTRCRVVWRRVHSRPGLPAGLGLEFLATEGRVRDLLVGYARGESIPYAERAGRRISAQLETTFRHPGGKVSGVSVDLSTGGLFMRTEETLPEGTRGTLHLKRPGRLIGLRIPATVTRCVEGPPAGLAFRFEAPCERHAAEIERLMRQVLRSRAPSGALVTPVQGRSPGRSQP